ncbi:MAG: cytochrome b/b6 domain-containing protein [Calditrichaeota bacterium]|nr:cytochrome b/b6 domain-containing protein [Calditrichota bacterium]
MSDSLDRILTEAGLDDEAGRRDLLEALATEVGEERLSQIITAMASAKSRALSKPQAPLTEPHVSHPRVESKTYLRFNLSTRIQHGVMALSVLILIVTGLPLKFHDARLSQWVMNLMGGIEVSAIVHRVGATLLIGVGLAHLLYISLTRVGRRDLFLLLPRFKDLRDWILMLKYYVGLTEEKARFGRFSYIEKFDYWAVYWGMVIMITSGSLLWFQDFFLKFIPKWMLDIAKEAHSDEALLATLAIIVWHFYNVHFSPAKFPMSKVFINGKLTREEMEDEHPLELEEMEKESQGRKTKSEQ